MNLSKAIASSDVKAVGQLLAKGVDPNQANEKTGETPLAEAAAAGNPAMVQLLLSHHADPNFKMSAALPLINAAQAGHLEVVSLLLEHGADVNARGENGDTPLIGAAAGGYLVVVEKLLAAGANPKACDLAGSSAVIVAAEKGHANITKLLLPKSSREDRGRVESIVMTKAQVVSQKDVQKYQEAAREGDLPTVKKMLAKGIPVDVRSAVGKTALMEAANLGQIEVVKFLIELGADPLATNVYGDCAVVYSTFAKEPAILEMLWPMANSKFQKRVLKEVEFKQRLPHQHPKWQGWKPPMPDSSSQTKKSGKRG